MAPSTLAVALELIFVLAGVAVALLLIFQLRLQARFTTLDLDVQRLNKAHRDGALDARSRLEEASKALEELERQVGPRIEALEPHMADVGARLDEAWARLGVVETRLDELKPDTEDAERRQAEAREALDDAKVRLEQAEEVARGAAERLGEVDEALRDARTRLKRMEEAVDHLRSIHGDKFVEFGQRLDAMDTKFVGLAERAASATAFSTAVTRKAKKAAKAAGLGDPLDMPLACANPKPEPTAVAASKIAPKPTTAIKSELDWRMVVLIVLLAGVAIVAILNFL